MELLIMVSLIYADALKSLMQNCVAITFFSFWGEKVIADTTVITDTEDITTSKYSSPLVYSVLPI